MKKVIFLILVFLWFVPRNVLAEEVHIYLFYGSTCSICEQEKEFLNTLENIKVHEYETFYNEKNYNLMKEIKQLYGINKEGVPFTVVGDTAVFGFNSSRATRISNLVNEYSKTDYYDRVGVTLGLYEDEEIKISEEEKELKEEVDREDESNNSNWIYIIPLVIVILSVGFLYLRNKKVKG